jgi:hypothetical protein
MSLINKQKVSSMKAKNIKKKTCFTPYNSKKHKIIYYKTSSISLNSRFGFRTKNEVQLYIKENSSMKA